MLKPKYLDRLPDRMVELYSQAEIDILVDMAKRISAFKDFIPAAQWQYRKLIEMGNYHSAVVKTLSSLTGITERELREIMEEAGVKALAFDDSVYRKAGLDPPPLAASSALQDVLSSGLEKTKSLFQNLTSTTAGTATKQFEDALDRVYMQITSGAFSSTEAIRSAIKGLAKDGIASIRYPTGHTDSMDVAVRRAVLTGVNQTALKLQDIRAEEMGCDLVETSAHSGARPDHAQWQGKVFSRSGIHPKYKKLTAPQGEGGTGYGTGAGLGGWNCRHSFYPYFEGISEPANTHAELAEMNAPKYEYNGQRLTEYDATQRQRQIERNLRRWKREYKAMEAAGLDTSEASSRLSRWRDVQKDFLKQTGLKRQNDREAVTGFGRSEAARVRSQAKQPVLTNASGQRIIAVKHTSLTGEANSITQRTSASGNVDRNYYGSDGRQTKQISSTPHGHKAVMGYGQHGEHAHDYVYDADGKLAGRPHRELTEDERKENEDIL